jgi:hypothetical protein
MADEHGSSAYPIIKNKIFETGLKFLILFLQLPVPYNVS